MWCPYCRMSFNTIEELCPRCGRALSPFVSDGGAKAQWGLNFGSKLMDKWPADEAGVPDRAAFLAHKSSVNMEDKLLVNMLEAYGIPAFMNHPMDGCFGKVVLGMSGDGSDIFVPLSMLYNAKELMEDVQDD